MTELLLALAETGPARALRASGTGYLLVNALHLLGICLLLGAILPLDLRLLGAFSSVPLRHLATVLRPMALAGFLLAAFSGALLFSVNPAEYLTNGAFRWKLALILLALVNLGVAECSPALRAARAGGPSSPGLRRAAAASALLWIGVLIAGRWIGFL